MKDRVIVCEHYVNEGTCDLGKEGTFWHHCQTCGSYKKKAGAKPARTDNRKQKLDRIRRREDKDL
jgi:hypothetical protein